MTAEHLPQLVLSFDTSVYRLNAIKKAAYRFGDCCFVQISLIADREAEVTLQCKSLVVDLDRFAGEFVNEVLDQELREVVATETAAIRNLLLAQAFSATSLVDQSGETADYRSDPMGIRRPDRD